MFSRGLIVFCYDFKAACILSLVSALFQGSFLGLEKCFIFSHGGVGGESGVLPFRSGVECLSPSPPASGIPGKLNMGFSGSAEIKRLLGLSRECSRDFCEKEEY